MLERDPECRVIVGAYSATLGTLFSRRSRRIAETRFALSRERRTAEHWETPAGGGIKSVGVGTGVTGWGGNLIIIDDPVKSREEAESETYRNRCWDWYRDDLYTRLEPGGSIVLIMTRWHEDDLAGRILRSEEGPQWRVVRLPALAEEGDVLGRTVGQPLCPERFDLEALGLRRTVLGSRGFSALYQQRPMAAEGGMFKREDLQAGLVFEKELPTLWDGVVRYWDKAATADGGDYSVGLLMAKAKNGYFYVLDVRRGQWSSKQREDIIAATAAQDHLRFEGLAKTWIEQEPGSGGKDSAAMTVRNLLRYGVQVDRPSGPKPVRAYPFSAAVEARLVRIVRSSWTDDYIDELCAFDAGLHDDQVDGSSGAYNHLVLAAPQRARSHQG